MSAVDSLVLTLKAEIPEAMSRRRIPGLAIGITDSASTLWSASYGTTERAAGNPITPSTRFSVQSTSKLFTATLVLLGVQQGLLDLDEPIAAYLPDFAINSIFDGRPEMLISLRHLLSHTSGLTHEAPVGSNFDLGNGDWEAHCRSISETWLRYPVGHHFEYSNLGIDLAAHILERRSGVAFTEFAARELFEPLGLTRSTFDPHIYTVDGNRAVGHWRPFENAGRSLPVEIPMVAAGGLYTTVDDALRFIRFQLADGESVLSDELISEQRRVPFPLPGQRLGCALAVYVDEWDPGVRVYHHGGSGFGFQSQLFWLPDLGIGGVVLTNSFDHSLQNELALQIARHVAQNIPRRSSNVPAALPLPERTEAGDPTDFAALPGDYIGRNDDLCELRLENGELVLRRGGTSPARVVAPQTIELESPGRERYRFSAGRFGPATYLQAVRDGNVWYRNDAKDAGLIEQAHVGEYDVRNWGLPTTRYRLGNAGGSPTIERVWDVTNPDFPRVQLRLSEIGEDLFISSTGEVLDLRGSPRYAGVALERIDETEASGGERS